MNMDQLLGTTGLKRLYKLHLKIIHLQCSYFWFLL